MNEYRKKLNDLYALEFFGMKLGLDNIRTLLERIGNPQRQFPAIHVAGTNGKGSVCAMLAAVHQTAGKKTGLYTSPHLVDFRERIKVDGTMISEQEVFSFLERVWPIVEELRLTFFEVTTAMAFDHFARHKVDIALIETGLGGRLDATNVLEKPLATVVTSIGHDHHAQLGPTLEDIAREKAGIFKPFVPAVVSCMQPLIPIFSKMAHEQRSPLVLVNGKRNPLTYIRLRKAPYPGLHQRANIRTVLATLGTLPYRTPAPTIRQGISETVQLTGFRSRLEHIKIPGTNHTVWLDVGHNPEAVEAVAEFFLKKGIRPVIVFGIMRDKEIEKILETIKRFASRFIGVAVDNDRALPSADLVRLARKAGLAAIDGKTVLSALEEELRRNESSDILIAGSHYIVGEFLKNFPRYLTEELS